jgi:hypothetical protein
MNSAIVEEGSAADGDGHDSYAARRRNLACRPSALGRHTAHTKACRSTAPDQPADFATQPTDSIHAFIAQKPSPPPGYTIVADVRLDYLRES